MKQLKSLWAWVVALAAMLWAFVRPLKRAFVAVLAFLLPMLAMAETDATTIATNAQTAFNVVAPIVITVATFFVVVRIAKRVTRG